jgi:predicted Zn-dependent protease
MPWHGAERMSQGLVAQGAVLVASSGAATQGISRQVMAGGALANYGFILPYSRKHESEADYIGLLLAADAGYD